MKTSGLLDTRLYDNPCILTHILALLDGDITSDEKGKTSIHSKCKSSNSAPISSCNRKKVHKVLQSETE